MTTTENGEKKIARTERAVILLTKEEMEDLSKRAEGDGRSISAYVRRLIQKDAERVQAHVSGDAKLTYPPKS